MTKETEYYIENKEMIDESIATIIKNIRVKAEFRKAVKDELDKFAKTWSHSPGALANRELEKKFNEIEKKYKDSLDVVALRKIMNKMKNSLSVNAFGQKTRKISPWAVENTVGSAMPMASASDGRSLASGPKMNPDGSFGGIPYFKVSSSTFNGIRSAKKKGQHWKTFLGADETATKIRKWARSNSGSLLLNYDNNFIKVR